MLAVRKEEGQIPALGCSRDYRFESLIAYEGKSTTQFCIADSDKRDHYVIFLFMYKHRKV